MPICGNLGYHTPMLNKGLVQIYTGQGKGKTTAALGLALRAAGRGNKVLIYQFLKPASIDTGERRALESIDLPITLDALDVAWDMFQSFEDKATLDRTALAISDALKRLTRMAREKKYDVFILDELVSLE